jgi:hypothetical protein
MTRDRPPGGANAGSTPAPNRKSIAATGPLLERDVLPNDIAKPCYGLRSEPPAKPAGTMINIDAGRVQAFTR